MEHKSLRVREERRALFLRVLPWKRKGKSSEVSVLCFSDAGASYGERRDTHRYG